MADYESTKAADILKNAHRIYKYHLELEKMFS